MIGEIIFFSGIGVALLFGYLAMRMDRVCDSLEPSDGAETMSLSITNRINAAPMAAYTAANKEKNNEVAR